MQVIISESSIAGLVWRKQHTQEKIPEPQRTYLIKSAGSLQDLVDHMIHIAAYDKQLIGSETSVAEKQVLKELGYNVNDYGLRLMYEVTKKFMEPSTKRIALVLRDKRKQGDRAVMTDCMVNGVLSVFGHAPVDVQEFRFKPRAVTLRGFKRFKEAVDYYKTIVPNDLNYN